MFNPSLLRIALLWGCLGAQCFAQQVVNGFSSPTGITSDGKRYFISNQGYQKSSGFISEVSENGTMIRLKLFPQTGHLKSPKGITIQNQILYVADADRILGFDLRSQKKSFELIIPSAQSLEALCPMETGYLAVTESSSGKIYKINTKDKSYETIGQMPTVNGIAYNEKTDVLAITTHEKNNENGGVYIRSGRENFKQLTNIPRSIFKGIAFAMDNHLLIADYVADKDPGFGKVWRYDLKTDQVDFQFTASRAENIHYDHSTDMIWMAQEAQNSLTLLPRIKAFSTVHDKHKVLYNYGVIDGLIGGLYKGTLPVNELKLKGDFGIGAPDMLDGELTLLDGKAYQTKATGETLVLPDQYNISFSSVNFFKADTTFYITSLTDQKAILEVIQKALANKNSMYAIKISGDFEYVKTRAFPPTDGPPFPVLSTILDKQKFFDHQNTSGTLIGYHLPEFINGINANGFHFHYLSNDKANGGHMIDFKGKNQKIEISQLKSLELDIPTDADFQNFQFPKRVNEDLKRVEKGY
jgi:alpha-acetolactate decarboxylase